MLSRAPSVYDDHLVRTLLGHAVYILPAGSITRQHYDRALDRLKSIDVLLVTGGQLNQDVQARLGWLSPS
jgi:deoxyhypusine synthase